MAILALAQNFENLKIRIGKIVIGSNLESEPITVDDLGLTGAVATLLKDCIHPTLMQTLQGTPVLIHAGPFANIAHGNSSVLADN
eukprot:Pgem_evm1s17167